MSKETVCPGTTNKDDGSNVAAEGVRPCKASAIGLVVGVAGIGGMALSGDADDDCVPFILANFASSSKTLVRSKDRVYGNVFQIIMQAICLFIRFRQLSSTTTYYCVRKYVDEATE